MVRRFEGESWFLLCPICGALPHTTCVEDGEELLRVHPSRKIPIAERNRRTAEGWVPPELVARRASASVPRQLDRRSQSQTPGIAPTRAAANARRAAGSSAVRSSGGAGRSGVYPEAGTLQSEVWKFLTQAADSDGLVKVSKYQIAVGAGYLDGSGSCQTC